MQKQSFMTFNSSTQLKAVPMPKHLVPKYGQNTKNLELFKHHICYLPIRPHTPLATQNKLRQELTQACKRYLQYVEEA